MLSAGGYDISFLVFDNFRLDGGAMFGSVPKTLWSKVIDADEKNRIPLVCRGLLLKGHGRTVLVDVGCGTKWSEKERAIYAIENLLTAEQVKTAAGEVTDLILTHLHFDHAAGATDFDADGVSQLRFPDANIFVQNANWQNARNPGPREKASYLAHSIDPLEKGKLNLVEDGATILPEISVHIVNGHTKGMQWVKIGSGDNVVVFAADLIPTSHHIPVPYVMGYDLCAETSMKEKERFLKDAVNGKWQIVFEHDSKVPSGRVTQDARGAFVLVAE